MGRFDTYLLRARMVVVSFALILMLVFNGSTLLMAQEEPPAGAQDSDTAAAEQLPEGSVAGEDATDSLNNAAETEPETIVVDTAPAQDSPRNVRRLGDVATSGEELDLSLDVPQGPQVDIPDVRLPNIQQQEELRSLLTAVTIDSTNTEAATQLAAMLAQLTRRAENAIQTQNYGLARTLLTAVRTANPAQPNLAQLEQTLRDSQQRSNLLSQAQTAQEEGRLIVPAEDNALFYFRQILTDQPDNPEALQGVADIRTRIGQRVLATAQAQDFDAAESLLDQADGVFGEGAELSDVRQQVEDLRSTQRQDLLDTFDTALAANDFTTAEAAITDMVAFGFAADEVSELRDQLENVRVYSGYTPGDVITDVLSDGNTGPATIVLSLGSFMMGSADNEDGRQANESPQHSVEIKTGIAVGQREVTVAEFRAFINATGYRTTAERSGNSLIYDPGTGRITRRDGMNWQFDYMGERATDDLPVIHVSWTDTQAYVQWLSSETGETYRLPSEAEFEYALRAGSQAAYWWGEGVPSNVVENLTGDGDRSPSRGNWTDGFRRYRDGYWGPAPVSSFVANPFGLFDIGGNVAEWVQDCWHSSYAQAPAEGIAWVNPGCSNRVIRGAYWGSSPSQARSAFRLSANADVHGPRVGFRIVREL